MDSWHTEEFMKKTVSQSYKTSRVLHSEQSKYQKIEVLETYALGKLLLLDGKTMVSDLDEFVYHEVMAHIPYAVAPSIKKVLIIGGGDGGVVREFARHPSITQIDLVEIDERVIEVSKIYFPHCTSALGDSRVRILPTDGIEYVKQFKGEYDVIIVDSTDPVDFAEGLFRKEFYASVYDALTENGIMMAQTENPFYDEYGLKGIYSNLKTVFPNVESFTAPMPIYPGTYWTFAFASKGIKATKLLPDKKEELDRLEADLKWYNTKWHLGAFALGNFHKRQIGLCTHNVK